MDEFSLVGALAVVQTVLEYVGTIAFAVSGALAAGRARMDSVGVAVLGGIVAVGGGTLRDVMLGVPAFWIKSPSLAVTGIVTALVCIPLMRLTIVRALLRVRLVQLFDAVGLAFFVVVGTNVALAHGTGPTTAVLLGVLTGIGGGIARDVLAREIPTVLHGGYLYATAALIGAVAYVVLLQFPVNPLVVFWLPILLILSVRIGALYRRWGLPSFDVHPAG